MAVRPSACLLAVRWRDGTPERGTLRGRLAWFGIAVGCWRDRLAIASCQRQPRGAWSVRYTGEQLGWRLTLVSTLPSLCGSPAGWIVVARAPGCTGSVRPRPAMRSTAFGFGHSMAVPW